jgi:putative ABC transport system permease protein
MFKISLKNLLANKRRLIGTCSAVLLGVAFLAGTLVLGDTMRNGFDEVFTTANAGTDVIVRAKSLVGSDDSQQRGTLDPSLAARVEAVPGVAKVVPQITGIAQLVARNGDPLGGKGPPTLAANWIDDATLNPFRLDEGHAPRHSGEVVIDRGSADKGKLHLGDTTTVRTPTPLPVKIVGIASFGDADSLGGATYTLFTTAQAQQVLGGGKDRVNALLVTGAAGTTPAEVSKAVKAVLPKGTEALTGTQLTNEQVDAIGTDFLNFFEGFLLVFSGVAMLVATFSIHNTFSVVLAQRTRESALLRALGATRRQVLQATGVETLIVGVIASGLGVLAGLGLAAGLQALLQAVGLGLPPSGLVVTAQSLWIAALVGIVVTLLAGLAPALGASRVPPLAALRAVAVEKVGTPRLRGTIGLVLLGGGLVLSVGPALGWFDIALAWVGVGAAATIIGMVAFGPLVARPVASLLGRPIARLRGVSGSLARQNAMRNPRRTSGTATALMVGVGVVTLFMVFGASIAASVDDTVARSIRADLIVQTEGFSGAGLSPQLAGKLRGVDGVTQATPVGFGSVRIGSSNQDIEYVDFAELPGVLDLDVRRGDVGSLGHDEIAVSQETIDEEHWRYGQTVPVRFVDGARQRFRIGAVYESEDFAGNVVMPRAAYVPHTVQQNVNVVLVALKPGVDAGAASHAVDRAGKSLGAPDSLTRAEFVDEAAGRIDNILMFVYVLLALSIIIALMGIANTLSLSIHERTRELGLLRAVGQTRAQTRAMVRWEAVVISLFGTLAGAAVGVLMGWALVKGAAADSGVGVFSAPVTSLVVIVVLGGLVGVVAGLRPARRAARIDVLEAIATS